MELDSSSSTRTDCIDSHLDDYLHDLAVRREPARLRGRAHVDRSGSFAYSIRLYARTEREYASSLRDLVLWA